MKPYSDSDITMLARTVYGEARGCTPEEWALVVWTVLQRVDADEWDDTIAEVVTAQGQFAGYNAGYPVEEAIREVCAAEVAKWARGGDAPTHEVYAPRVPYYFFDASCGSNWFREEWRR